MAAHNFNNVNVPTSNVLLYVRPGVSNQESQASVAFNFYFNTLNEWTNKPYFEIQMNQNPQLSILALPDVSVDWYGLSMIGIWWVSYRFTFLLKLNEQTKKHILGPTAPIILFETIHPSHKLKDDEIISDVMCLIANIFCVLREPYILMENTCSVKQRFTGLLKMAEALSKQWFGYVIFPENWQYEWVVSGLSSYAAWDILRTVIT